MTDADGDVDVPPAAAMVVGRYHRIERAASTGVALLVGLVCGVALTTRPLAEGLLVTAIAIGVVRVPVLRSAGSVRLATDADPDAVRADFESPTPPMLAFQWGIADEVRETAQGAAYHISYALGLRSAEMRTTVTDHRERSATDEDADDSLIVRVTVGGREWGTYTVTIDDTGSADAGTIVDVTMTADRRFGLRAIPQILAVKRYYQAVMAAQGYTVVERERSLGL